MLSKVTQLCDLTVYKMTIYQHYETVDNIIRFFILIFCQVFTTAAYLLLFSCYLQSATFLALIILKAKMD